MNLVDDDRLHRPQSLCGLRCQQQVKRLGRGDQDLRWMQREAGALALRRIPGAHADRRLLERQSHAPRHVRHAHQRRAKVPLHIHGQRLQRRNINNAATPLLFACSLLTPVSQHQPVQAPEKCAQGLAGAGRRQDQRALSARNHRPAKPLRCRWRVKDSFEPRRRHRMETGQRVGDRGWNWNGFGDGPARGHSLFENNPSGSEEEAKIRLPASSLIGSSSLSPLGR